MRVKLTIASCFIVLLLVNMSIYKKEKLLAEGDIVYLKLAPVDPRSLMQGDYMALRFAIAREIYSKLNQQQKDSAIDGKIVVTLDKNKIGRFKRFENDKALESNEHYMQYRVRNNRVKFATNAFFFEEGKGELYSEAKYGLFRVANNGELLLTNLHDDKLNLLK